MKTEKSPVGIVSLLGLICFRVTDATNSLKTSVSEGKSLITAAVTDKGVSTAADASFSTIASNIGSIPSGSNSYEIVVDGSNSKTLSATYQDIGFDPVHLSIILINRFRYFNDNYFVMSTMDNLSTGVSKTSSYTYAQVGTCSYNVTRTSFSITVDFSATTSYSLIFVGQPKYYKCIIWN